MADRKHRLAQREAQGYVVPTAVDFTYYGDHMRKVACLAFVCMVAFSGTVQSQEKKDAAESHKIVHFGDLKWAPIIKGCDVAPVRATRTPKGRRLFCVFAVRTVPRF